MKKAFPKAKPAGLAAAYRQCRQLKTKYTKRGGFAPKLLICP
ncbi:MAG TPA: hypothetical protein O0W95_06315 [Methanocorpusculum sp.]|nr:hypothetical protein [Methanocorpusculum sp.]